MWMWRLLQGSQVLSVLVYGGAETLKQYTILYSKDELSWGHRDMMNLEWWS